MTMAILGKEGKLMDGRFELLINRERSPNVPSPLLDWLPDTAWTAANALKVFSSKPSPVPFNLTEGKFNRQTSKESQEDYQKQGHLRSERQTMSRSSTSGMSLILSRQYQVLATAAEQYK